MHRLLPLAIFVACAGGDMGTFDKDKTDGGDSLPTLSLAAIVPSEGPVEGGTHVTLGGAGFTEDMQVTVGGAACATLTVLSSVEIDCATPPGLSGPANVAAVRPGDGATASIAFTYVDTNSGDDGTTDGGTADGGTTDGGTTDGGTTDGGTTDGGGTDGGGTTDGGTTDGGGTGGDTSDTAVPVTPVDYCHVQWPCTQTVAASAASADLYVWVYQGGVTEGAGRGAGVTVQLGVGPDGSDPASAAGWTWSSAAYNVDKDGLSPGDLANDEYTGTFTAPSTAGAYDYCGRVSVDSGASWTYCDLGGSGCSGGGSGDGYSAATAGQLTVP